MVRPERDGDGKSDNKKPAFAGFLFHFKTVLDGVKREMVPEEDSNNNAKILNMFSYLICCLLDTNKNTNKM
jgi:hypothetical protein